MILKYINKIAQIILKKNQEIAPLQYEHCNSLIIGGMGSGKTYAAKYEAYSFLRKYSNGYILFLNPVQIESADFVDISKNTQRFHNFNIRNNYYRILKTLNFINDEIEFRKQSYHKNHEPILVILDEFQQILNFNSLKATNYIVNNEDNLIISKLTKLLNEGPEVNIVSFGVSQYTPDFNYVEKIFPLFQRVSIFKILNGIDELTESNKSLLIQFQGYSFDNENGKAVEWMNDSITHKKYPFFRSQYYQDNIRLSEFLFKNNQKKLIMGK